MADKIALLTELINALREPVEQCGFHIVRPRDIPKEDAPIETRNGRSVIIYKGADRHLRIEQFDDKIYLLGVQKEGEITDADYSQLLVSLFEPETANSKDAKYIAAEFSQAVQEQFGSNEKKQNAKLPSPVSKAAARSGAESYDANTLANRISVMFPELREAYKQNVAQYGEFLPEDFFIHHGNAPILQTIRENNAQKMRKLFNLLNEIYDDGTNEIQSIIAVTIMGELHNDEQLLANCVDYMSADMLTPVIQINKFLASSSARGSRMRLENPPPYKPKRAKKQNSFLSNLGMQ